MEFRACALLCISLLTGSILLPCARASDAVESLEVYPAPYGHNQFFAKAIIRKGTDIPAVALKLRSIGRVKSLCSFTLTVEIAITEAHLMLLAASLADQKGLQSTALTLSTDSLQSKALLALCKLPHVRTVELKIDPSEKMLDVIASVPGLSAVTVQNSPTLRPAAILRRLQRHRLSEQMPVPIGGYFLYKLGPLPRPE